MMSSMTCPNTRTNIPRQLQRDNWTTFFHWHLPRHAVTLLRWYPFWPWASEYFRRSSILELMWRSCRLRSWYWCGGMRNLHSFGVCCCWRIRLEVEFDKYSIGEADSIHKLVWGTESCGRAAVFYRQASVNGMRYCDCEMRRVEWEDTTRPHYKAWWRVTRLSWRLVLRCFTIMTPVLLRTSEGLRAEASVRHSRVAICCSSDSQSSTSEASVKPKPHVSLRSPSKPAPSPEPSVCQFVSNHFAHPRSHRQ